ncbi:MAG: hypothetical protein ACI9ZT_001262 [Gammaproteobacteria bacterium]|jgi:hypothetical protein
MKELEILSKVGISIIALLHFLGIMWFLSYASILDRIVAFGFVASVIMVTIVSSIPIKEKSNAMLIIILSVFGSISLFINLIINILNNNYSGEGLGLFVLAVCCFACICYRPYFLVSEKLEYDA